MDCPNCNFPNAAAAKNCINCGSGMTELPEPQRKHVGEIETWPASHVGAAGTRRATPDNGKEPA
jgi:hypothetical protein